MESKARGFARAGLAALALCAAAAQAQQLPSQADVVQAQGRYASAELAALAAVFGADPSGGASREAFEKGMAPAMLSWSSPVQGWPARGPSLRESIEPLLAMRAAAKMGCERLEGPCQAKAAAAAKAAAKKVLDAKNPGAELAAQAAAP